jgi:hypothetical protein
MEPIKYKKYIIVFVITAVIFATAVYFSNFMNAKRAEEIKAIEDRIAIDILSSETQFDLLKEASCRQLNDTVLSSELNRLSERLSYMEQELGANNAEVFKLKRYYSLLQIKDYLLMQEISKKCQFSPISILYFYSNKGDCQDCKREGYVLTHLREQYPALRVYSFDYNLDLSATKTLIDINKLNGTLPALVIDDKIYYGYMGVEDLEAAIPELKTLNVNATSTATTTQGTTSRWRIF